MINLITGLPGSYKSNSVVHELMVALERRTKGADAFRPVYTNINGLDLPGCLPLPTKRLPFRGKDLPENMPDNCVDWASIPDGSDVYLDEAQSFFPLRGGQDQVPEHVAWLNTHRHHGIDIWVITQHPKLIDVAVRRLVGRHQHFRRVLGWRRSIVYEWDHCDDGLQGIKVAITSHYTAKTEAFKHYKSTVEDRKQKFKKPWWIWVLPVAVVLGLALVPFAYGRVKDIIVGKIDDVKSVTKPPALAGTPTASVGPAPVAFPVGLPPPVAPSPAPWAKYLEEGKLHDLAKKAEPVEPPKPHAAGCAVVRGECTCFDSKGGKVEKVQDMCEFKAAPLGGDIRVDAPATPRPSDGDVLAWMAARHLDKQAGR